MRGFHHILLTITCLAISYSFYAQEPTAREIKQKIQKATPKQKADLYLDLGLQLYYETGQPDSLLNYTLRSLELARQIKDVRTEINALKFSSSAYALKGDFVNSNKQLDEGLRLSKKIKHKMNIADIYNKYGYNYQLQNQSEQSIKAYINAAKIFAEIKNYNELIIVYQNISTIFSELDQLDETIFYTNKMIENLHLVTDKFNKVSTYSAIASQFKYISKSKPIYYDSIYKYAQLGIPIAKKNKLFNEVSELQNALGYYYYKRKNTDAAINSYQEALSNMAFINDAVKFDAYIGLHNCYIRKSQLPAAGSLLDSVKNIPLINQYLSLKIDYLNAKYLYEKKTNKTGQALATLEIVKTLEDSLLNIDKGKRINELEQKYNRVKNESTIRDLSRDKKIADQKSSIQSLKINQLVIGLLLLFLILTIIIYLYYQSTQKRKRKIIEVEQRLNRARMDPHFVFNVLAAVQALQLDPLRKDEAPLFLSRISKVMRLTLESTYTELTSLEDEIDFLNEYLVLQKLLKNNCFDYSIEIADDIDPFDIQLPGMILQPFLENAIEHGVAGAQQDGFVSLKIEIVNNELHLVIFDNGKGKRSEHKERAYPSRATSIIQDRLSLLKDSYKKNARFETNLKEFGGYEVQIILPLL